jgi:predicted metal-dependent hydrolase
MSRVKTETVTYDVIRSRRKTADIVMEANGRILVRAPEKISDKRIADLVKSKQRWIFNTLAEWTVLNAKRVRREFRNGEGFFYLGRTYRLQLTEDQEEPLMLKNGRLCLQRELLKRGESEAKSAFRNFYIARGMDRIPARVDYFARKVGVHPGRARVRELGNRWASCSAVGVLAFHWKCLMAPQTIIDYIIVHELCHLRHFDHTEAFWNEVDKVLPDYRERKEWLRQNGASLDL